MSTETLPLPLPYQSQILTDILSTSAFLILARGLGIRRIMCAVMKLYSRPETLVILLNTPTGEEEYIKEELLGMGVGRPGLRIVNNELSAKERTELYLSGGIFSVTSRIFIVDILTKRISVEKITGIIVNHAERVTETSTEAFILRIFRQENENGFIKAFSDSPEAFVTGFSPLQTTMQCLQLRTVFIWPRFHVTVRESLESRKADVVELLQPLSDNMTHIQSAIVECMEACLSELKKANRSIDVEELTIENAMFRSFDRLVRHQLDPIWHRVSSKTKQMIGDLNVLRKLLSYLVTYDCVTFNSFLEMIIASNTPTSVMSQQQSPWLFTDSANAIFTVRAQAILYVKCGATVIYQRSIQFNPLQLAKERVYIRKANADKDSSKSSDNFDFPPSVEPILEELPKWRLLSDVLYEIEHETEAINAKNVDDSDKSNVILIMAGSERTCSQLREYLTATNHGQHNVGGSNPILKDLLRNYFRWKGAIPNVSEKLFKEDDKIASDNTTETGEGGIKQKYHRGQPPPNKRRRVRGGSSTAASSSRPAPSTIEEETKEIVSFLSSGTAPTDTSPSHHSSYYNDEFDAEAFAQYFDVISPDSLVIIRPYSNDDDDRLLETVKPKFIVMYQPDIGFVRRVEVFRASNPGRNTRVYFLMYENSVEEQLYLSSIRREKEAFEKIIREKSIMAIPLGQSAAKSIGPDDAFLRTTNTRVAGGRLPLNYETKVIVDVREFRSSLPSILHARGVTIVPCTLQVGDYILSPRMCVERKSVSDLVGSLNSGRLYTQCEAMSMYYKEPVLLIEFDQNKAFTLQGISDMKADIGVTDLSSKLVLLTLAFPRLAIIWSSSPYATVEIFEDLKKSHEEPDAEKAMAIGVEEGEETDSMYNANSQDVLRALPGITSKNYKRVMTQVENLKELSEMTLEQCQKLIGDNNGKMLYEFFRNNVKD
ncbi:10589_t:CDS:10 [Paraglomus brasilianum]|uniref:10589_t:CDS:1 n=1 Tax=Paraglomus brasilianum TaxID=144538 RepID=A0A9N9F229_9GLOM|nr:10589_t:CDS:10 [Paraglomus brasilianum]